MNQDNKNELFEVIKNNKAWPILVIGVDGSAFDERATIISARTPSAQLGIVPMGNGYATPQWLSQIESRKALQQNLLVIDKLDEIADAEQLKFVEIIKHKSISGHKFPANTQVIITAKNRERINKQLQSQTIIWSVS